MGNSEEIFDPNRHEQLPEGGFVTKEVVILKKLEAVFIGLPESVGELTPDARRDLRNKFWQILAEVSNREFLSEREDKYGDCDIDSFLASGLDPRRKPELYAGILRGFKLFHHPSDYQNDKQAHSSWVHSVCHRFELYRTPQEGKTNEYTPAYASVFELADKAAVADVLADFADRSIMVGDLSGNGPRILKPYLTYTLDSLRADTLDKPFALKPEKLTDPRFANIIRQDSNLGKVLGASEAFALLGEAKTPREFLIACIEKDASLVSFDDQTKKFDSSELADSTRANLVTLLYAVREGVSPEKFDAYFKKYFQLQDQNLTVDEVAENIHRAEQADEVVKGLFIDVEGTLLESAGTLNEGVLKSMEELSEAGNPIVIFTGGDPVALTERLRLLGIPENFLPVKSKDEYRGKVLGFLVDDTPANLQGFRALGTYNPRYGGPSVEEYQEALEKLSGEK